MKKMISDDELNTYNQEVAAYRGRRAISQPGKDRFRNAKRFTTQISIVVLSSSPSSSSNCSKKRKRERGNGN
jgi:hypothetical protein